MRLEAVSCFGVVHLSVHTCMTACLGEGILWPACLQLFVYFASLLNCLYYLLCFIVTMPSVLWCCWLRGTKGIRPVKTEWWGAGMVICLEWGADLHTAQLMPLPLTVFCFSKIQIGFTFLVPADVGSPGKRAVKLVCVCFIVTCYVVTCLRWRVEYFCWLKHTLPSTRQKNWLFGREKLSRLLTTSFHRLFTVL